MSELTVERLREVLHYDAEMGVFTWRVRLAHRLQVGDVAGKINRRHGRRYIGIDTKLYLEHRLAWMYVFGEWPKGDIDHINGNPLDNRIGNLRDVSHVVNMQNQRKARSSNTTGFFGVSRARNRFCALIRHEGRVLKLGSFDTPEEAHAAYIAAKRKYHEGCTV